MRKKNFGLILCILITMIPFATIIVNSFYQADMGISLRGYYEVFLGTPQYLLRFWKSIKICSLIAIGQVIISLLAGYGFARYDFYGKKFLSFILIVLMVIPLQVTLVPNHIMLYELDMLGKDSALIVPAIFLPLGTFIMTQSIQTVSSEVIQDAKLNGCNLLQMLIHVVVPMTKGSLICVGVLSFLDAWNMVEQPIAYLKNFDKYPIAVALAYVSNSNPIVQLVCCILVMIPPLFLFLCFHKEMVHGIIFAEEK